MANNCFSTPYKPESSTGLYLAQVLSHAEKHPEKLACVFQPRGPETAETLSYGELNKQVVTRAKLLVESGLSGQHVGLLFPTGIEFVVDFLACLAAGAYAVPMNLTKNAKQLERTLTILRDTGVKTILTTQETQVLLHAELRDIQALSGFRWLDERHAATQNRTLPSIQLDDTAFIQYTSGSTSAPKGVIVTHRNIIDNQLAIQKACDHQPGLIAGGWLPQFHDMGLIGHMLQPLFLGGTYVFMPPLNFIQRPLRWLQLIDQYRIHSSAAPNFGYEHCMKMIRDDKQIQQLDLSCWKVALNGSEPVKASTMHTFAERFACAGFEHGSFFPCYGMAETTLFVSGGPKSTGIRSLKLNRNALAQGKITTADNEPDALPLTIVNCGELSPHFACAIVDPITGSRCQDSTVGEIWLKGRSVAKGYLNQPDISQEVFAAKIAGEHDGQYLRTGDLGFVHGGCLFVTGRHKELMIVRGKNIYPYDLEQICNSYEHATGGNGASVFTVSDGDKTAIAAVVEIKKRSLRDQCHDVMNQDLKHALSSEAGITLDHLLLVPPGSLPKTTSGKVRRGECHRLLNLDQA